MQQSERNFFPPSAFWLLETGHDCKSQFCSNPSVLYRNYIYAVCSIRPESVRTSALRFWAFVPVCATRKVPPAYFNRAIVFRRMKLFSNFLVSSAFGLVIFFLCAANNSRERERASSRTWTILVIDAELRKGGLGEITPLISVRVGVSLCHHRRSGRSLIRE